jgi:hypothetical protein
MKGNLTEWVNLVMYGVTLLVFITGTALALWRARREKQGAQAEELQRIDSARGILESLLNGSVFGLVTAAEKEYGDGMGAVKKSAVLAELLRLLPERWRVLFDADTLGLLIEDGLAAAKEVWAKP